MEKQLKTLTGNYYIATGKQMNSSYQCNTFNETDLFFNAQDFNWFKRQVAKEFEIQIRKIQDHFMPDDRLYTEFEIVKC